MKIPTKIGRHQTPTAEFRLNRWTDGNPGDVKLIGTEFLELRVNYGPGYQVPYMQRSAKVVVLFCGGYKRTQTKNIKKA